MARAGKCFCGAVEVKVEGDPEAMGYCHCNSCRSWSAGPINAFPLWKPDAVTVTRGAGHVKTYQKTEMSQRQYCDQCGGHLMTNHPTRRLVDVYAATILSSPFEPELHAFYSETVLPIRDGLPKLEDFPRSWAARARRCRNRLPRSDRLGEQPLPRKFELGLQLDRHHDGLAQRR